MSPLALFLAGAALFLASAINTEVQAHAFAQPYDLPIPLWLYITGAGAAVALTFVVLSIGANVPGLRGYARFNLLRIGLTRAITHPIVLGVLQVLSIALFLLVITAGLVGHQSPFKNIAPTMVWVIWWVGMAYLSALIGDVWALISPWRIGFAWAETFYRRTGPGNLSLNRPYPAWLGVWPAALLFFVFAWTELVWQESEIPRNLALLIMAYSVITWTGMFVYGRERWHSHGEAFAVAFGLFARFAPLELGTHATDLCKTCRAGSCTTRTADCVNCYACFNRAAPESREWNLRPYAVGLLTWGPVPVSLMVFAILMLSTVTFDGFTETPAWVAIMDATAALPWVDLSATTRRAGSGLTLTIVLSLALAAFIGIFVLAYLTFGRFMAMAANIGMSDISARKSGTELARTFVLTLVPIALAYHLAHYLSYLLIAGQMIIPLASDPFGFGWNLFHTNHYRVDIGIINTKAAWYTAVISIVVGHVLAVYLAHIMALRVIGDHRAALRSQIPMLVLMVGYTMISLWILAQPIVDYEP